MKEHYVGTNEPRNKVQELPDKSTRIETPEGRFRIVYGVHVMKTDASTLQDAPAIAIEEGDDFSNPQEAERIVNMFAKNVPQFTSIFADSAEKHRPIFLVDSTDVKRTVSVLVPLVLPFVLRASKTYQEKIKKQTWSPSRRKFLKNLVIGTTAYGSGIVTQGVGALLHQTGHPDEAHKIDDVTETIDPIVTKILVRLRNLIMAQKMVGVFSDLKTKIPITELPVVVGAAHINLEKELTKTSAERLKEIKEIMGTEDSEILKKLMTIARMDFDDSTQKWVASVFVEPNYEKSLTKE